MDAAEKIENNVNRIIKNSKFEVVTKKLENALDITLIESVNDIDLNQFMSNSSGGRTLGNVVKIKRK